MTLKQLYEALVALAVNEFMHELIDADIKAIDSEILATKIVNLCLTGE